MRIAILTSLLLVSGGAAAQDFVPEALRIEAARICAVLDDEKARLGCFDAAFSREWATVIDAPENAFGPPEDEATDSPEN